MARPGVADARDALWPAGAGLVVAGVWGLAGVSWAAVAAGIFLLAGAGVLAYLDGRTS